MLIWTGPRESDIKYTGDFFSGSVTLYGKENTTSFCNTKNFRINHNNVTEEQTYFMVQNQKKIMQSENVEFMSYNPNLIFGSDEDVINKTVCLNDEKLMKFLDSKISFRKFASKFVSTLQSELILGKDCNFENLKKLVGSEEIIIQADIGSGGYKTFLMNEENEEVIVKCLNPNQAYLISQFYKINIPINIHAIIYSDEILITPGSIQVMSQEDNRILYRGADYIAYRDIDKNVRNQFEVDVYKLCTEIQKLGYLGILGIDAIIVDGVAQILEVNNRFQASTLLINKALNENNLCSLHELNYEAFKKRRSELISQNELKNLIINYSIYTFINTKASYHTTNILNNYKFSNEFVEYIDDGYIKSQESEDEAYLFRLIFNTNIVSIAEESYIRLHPNLDEPTQEWYNNIINGSFVHTKISLINQGVILDDDVKDYLDKKGGMQPGVYFAVDLKLNDKYIVNSPLHVRFVSLSPFRIKLKDGNLFLYYYGREICKVKISFTDLISKKTTSRGIPVERICLLATDRLRIQNSDFCTFKERHIPCRFCEVKYKSCSFNVDDIIEAVGYYFKDEKCNFRHILIGGLSNTIGKEKENICKIIKYIRQHSNMPIYLMCLPCVSETDIEDYVKLGVTEFGFNIEIFDRQLAKKLMPGKGFISLEKYEKALRKAVELLGNNGAVRSAFVVGLESMESLLSGVDFVCKLGAAPIFSVFRPIPFTEMENVNPPSNQWLFEAYSRAEKICESYALKLGPSCPYCQNNTLSFDEIIVGNTDE